MSTKINNHNHIYLEKNNSSSDYEELLRILLSMIQQFSQSFHQMLEQHQDTIKDTPTFQSFINKLKNKTEEEIQSLYDGMKSMRRMLEEVLERSLGILPDVLRQLQQNKGKVAYLQEQVDDKDLMIQGYKQKRVQIQKSLHEITFMYEKSRHEYLQLSKQINHKQQEYQTQKSYIRKTFMQVTENNEIEKKILQEMQSTNENLSKNLNQAKKEKNILEQQLIRITQELTRTGSKVLKLQSELEKKQLKIRQYQNQIETINHSQRKKSQQSYHSNQPSEELQAEELRQSFNQPIQEKKTQSKTRLNQQLHNYKIPTIKELNGSFIGGSAVRRSVGEYSDDGEQGKKNQTQVQQKMIPKVSKITSITDPYFSHYILISQSVKIKQDCQDMLNIDMKPYYNEIIDKRIPMHLWDQWIKNRLRELLRKTH